VGGLDSLPRDWLETVLEFIVLLRAASIPRRDGCADSSKL